MSEFTVNNKRIARNTLLLYVRTLIVMVVTLFTSRLVLKILGIDGYGLYNAIGGLVSIMAALSGIMNGAAQRFLTFSIGKGNGSEISKVFSSCVIIFLLSSLMLVAIGESAGLWYFYHSLVIPPGSKTTAFWVLQVTIFTLAVNVTQVPYNAALIAYEKMNIFALLSLTETFVKLAMVGILWFLRDLNTLIVYSLMMFMATILIRGISHWYVVHHIPYTHFKYVWDKSLILSIGRFAGWSFLGTLSYLSINQAIPLLLNSFFGVVANAAMGLANQVSGTISSFVTSFQTAFKPQLIKYHAQGKDIETIRLLGYSSKFSYLILFVIVFPICCNIDYLLTLWLGKYPPLTSDFCKLVLVYALIDTLINPLLTVMEAEGKVKTLYLASSLLFLLYVPLSYIFLKVGMSANSILLLKIIMGVCVWLQRTFLVQQNYPDFKIKVYVRKYILPLVYVTGICLATTAIFPFNHHTTFTFFLASFMGSFFLVTITSWFIGLNVDQRGYVLEIIKRKLKH